MHSFSLILDAFGSVATIAFGVSLVLIALDPKAKLPVPRVFARSLSVAIGSTGRVITMVLAAVLLAGGVRGLLNL